MMRLFVLLATIVAALSLAAPAQAHSTSWYWNRYKAQYELLSYGLEWEGEFDEVYNARCYGYGRWLRISSVRGSSDRAFGFRHFRCKVSTFDDEVYWIVFHVTGRDAWTFRWLGWTA